MREGEIEDERKVESRKGEKERKIGWRMGLQLRWSPCESGQKG